MISQLDVFPTLCEMLSISKPSWLQGKSFLPVLRGETHEINDAIFAEVNYHAAYEPKRAVRTKRWKYIRQFGDWHYPVLPNCDDGLSKSYWVENGWAKHRVAQEELYDLVFDPNERNNLVGNEQHRTVLEDMRKRLNVWMHSTNDPLLHGPVKAPPGAKVNYRDAISPSSNKYFIEK